MQLERTTEDVLYGTVREGSFAMGIVDHLWKDLELKYVGLVMIVLQRLGTDVF